MGARDYQICTRCIMDTSDPDITFDNDGACNHCRAYEARIRNNRYLTKKRPEALREIITVIKKAGNGKPYDCVIGVSGGVDSTYLAYVTQRLGLRPFAVHLDNGWDSELAVSNIEKALKQLGIDLFTYVLDWEEFRNLQLSFLKASTPDAEIPTDHAILAVLYKAAADRNIRFILSGHNTATESIGAAAWAQGHGDWRYIKNIQKMFGTKPLVSFPHYGPWRFFYYALIRRIVFIPILDFIDYKKASAVEELEGDLGWKNYGGKHFESVYTRFYRGYFLPKKFGFDKRREDYSALIVSGQMSREEALRQMSMSNYSIELQEEDRLYVLKKLNLTETAFEAIMSAPPKTFYDYPSYKKMFWKYRWLISIYHLLKRQ